MAAQSALHTYEFGVNVQPGETVYLEVWDPFSGANLFAGTVANVPGNPPHDVGFDTSGEGPPPVPPTGGTPYVYLPRIGLYLFSFSGGDLDEPISYVISDPSGVFTPGTFYFPASFFANGMNASPDTYFSLMSGEMSIVSPDGASFIGPIDAALGERGWTLPYDRATLCSAPGVTCGNGGQYGDGPHSQFISAGVETEEFYNPDLGGDGMGVRHVPTFPVKGPVVLPSNWPAVTWDVSRLTLEFPAAGYLEVNGTLNVSGATLTAANPVVGWGGVRFQPSSGGAWTGATVERVAGVDPTNADAPAHMVSVTDASPTFTSVRLQLPVAGYVPVNGFYVRETAAPQNAVVITTPTVTGMTGSGVVGNGTNVRVEVRQGTITGSDGPAVVASGSGANVYLVPLPGGPTPLGPVITGNEGGGVAASSSGAVRFAAPSPADGFAEVRDNQGRGLSATTNGLVYAGTTTVYRRNAVYSNGGTSSTGNGLASGTGAAVYARCNWWNTETAPFRTGVTGSGTVNVSDPLATDPYVSPTATCGGGTGGGSGRPAYSGQDVVAGREGATAADRLLAAIDAPSPSEAVGLLGALVAAEPESAEATAALAEAGGIAGRPAAPAAAGALLAATTLSPYAALRVAAWQALVASRQAQGDRAGALDAAAALAAEGGAAVVFAEAARVYLHASAGDTTAAVSALAALESLAPGSIEADLARSYLGASAAAAGGRPAPVAPGARAAMTAGAEVGALAVTPNPASSSAAVAFTLVEPSDVAVTVVDVLGRAVQTALSGVLPAGAHRAEVDVRALAPGVYVVRATANNGSGSVVETARLTVAR